ncbi:hypothetical protein [Paraburkholderia sp. J12]|uniref:hypothetical protein n=1 Tax=Paraburkholderia sp. J12 TaxID=2805432 RepID=UPI002ABDB0BC|nr:hypothetical protein [Paraburkholderia sp. J12]
MKNLVIPELDPFDARSQTVQQRSGFGFEGSVVSEGMAKLLFRRALRNADPAGEPAVWRGRGHRLDPPSSRIDSTP